MAKLRVYFDLCALKRPWDDQSQFRIRAETLAMVALVDPKNMERMEILRSPAHDEENRKNSDPDRAKIIREWLESLPLPSFDSDRTNARAMQLKKAGLRGMDMFHAAFAESAGADILVTTDDRFLTTAARCRLNFRAVLPTTLLGEMASHETDYH